MSAPLMGGLVQGHCVRRSRGGYRRALPASGGFGGLAIDALGGGPRAKVEFGLSLARRSGISPDGQLIAVEKLHLDVLSKPCPSITGAAWSLEELAKVSNRLTVTLMGIVLTAVLALYLAASVVQVYLP